MTNMKSPKQHPVNPSHREPTRHGSMPPNGGGHHDVAQSHSHEHEPHSIHRHEIDNRHHE
jgi:hypothetical protein